MNEDNKILKVYDVIDPEEEKIISAVYEKDKFFFDMAVKLLKLFPSLKEIVRPENVSKEVVEALLGLHTQSFRLFRSIVILCKSGLASEAFVQLRSLLEVISYLLYIAEKEHKGRLEYYQHSRNLSEEVMMDKFLLWFPKDKKKKNEKCQQIFQKKKEAIEYFRKKHSGNFPEKIKEEIKKLACINPKNQNQKKEKIEIIIIKRDYCLKPQEASEALRDKKFFKKMYDILYPHASAISHGEKIDEFIYSTDNPTEFRGRLMGGHTRECLIFSYTLFFFGCERINELFQIGKDNVISNMWKEFETVVRKDNKQIVKS